MLGRRQEFNLKLNQILDSALLALAFWAAHALRAYAPRFFDWQRIPPLQEFYWQMLLIVPFTPLVLEKFGYYAHPSQKTAGRSLTQLCQGMALMVLLTSVFVAFGQQTAGSRAVVL